MKTMLYKQFKIVNLIHILIMLLICKHIDHTRIKHFYNDCNVFLVFFIYTQIWNIIWFWSTPGNKDSYFILKVVALELSSFGFCGCLYNDSVVWLQNQFTPFSIFSSFVELSKYSSAIQLPVPIWQGCCKSAVVAPVRYECDLKDSTGTYVKLSISLMKKLTNRA